MKEITYRQVGDYLIPNLTLPKEEKKPKAEDENLISDEKLTKIIYAIIIAVSILWVLWSILFRK